jgi:integrase
MIKDATTLKGKKIKIIEFSQKKTIKNMGIYLSPKVEKILKKRNGEFPRKISEPRYNEYVKIVCQEAGINEIVEGSMKDKESNRQVSGKFEKYKLICSHTGRRSFASNNYMKYPIGFLKNHTGHSSERTFLDYIGKTNLDYSLAYADKYLEEYEDYV